MATPCGGERRDGLTERRICMKTRTRMMTLYLLPEEREAVRARAAECGETVSAYLRAEALRPPRRLPVRKRVAGLKRMDEAGSALGHAIRGEEGRTPAEAWPLAMRLHAAIMALHVETAAGLPPAWSGRRGNAGNQRRVSQDRRMEPVQFLATLEEEDAVKRLAACFGMPVSAYVRRRALGKPLRPEGRPAEGMPAVWKCISLLGHAAWTGAAPMAARLYREARRKYLQLEEEADAA